MKKFKYLVIHGLKKRIKSKAFIIASIIVGIIIMGITVLPSLINLFDSDDAYIIKDKIIIINESGYDSLDEDVAKYYMDNISTNLDLYGIEDDLDITYLTSNDDNIPLDETYYELDRDEQVLIYISKKGIVLNPINPNDFILDIKIFSNGLDSTLYDLLILVAKDLQRFKYKVDNPGFDDSLIGDLVVDLIDDPTIIVDDGFNLVELIAPLLVVPIFILITFSIQGIGADIIEEKSTKAIEIIIASVPPKTHFLSKVISINLFVVIQLLIYVAFGVVGGVINELISGGSGSVGSWGNVFLMFDIKIVPLFIIVFVSIILGSVLYSVIGAFFASLAVNQEDYQQIQTPVMMILMIGYFVSIFSGISQSSMILKVFSFIPFFSSMVIPITYISGSVGIWGTLLSLTFNVLFIVLLIYITSPLYKVSILSYDTSSLFKRMKNIIRSSKQSKKNLKDKKN